MQLKTIAAWWSALATVATLAVPLSATAADNEPIDRELQKYWNTELAVPSLTNPLFERKHGVEGTIHGGAIPNDNFYLFKSIGGRVGFFLTDTVALEGDFSYLLSSESKILNFLGHVPAGPGKEPASLTIGAQHAPKLHWVSTLGVAYSPLHGKIGIFDKKISSFDMNCSVGAAFINADIDESLGNKTPVNGLKAGGSWGLGFRFYLTRFLNIRIDYKQYIYKPQESITFLAPVQFTAGLAFLSK